MSANHKTVTTLKFQVKTHNHCNLRVKMSLEKNMFNDIENFCP